LHPKTLQNDGLWGDFYGKRAKIHKSSEFCLQKINNFFAEILKKLLHFSFVFSIIVMRRGGKSHESV